MAGFTATAQVKVGDNAAAPMNTSAVLELESTDKGLLLPRVALTSTTAFAPLSAHVAGMEVYNTATAGTAETAVTPGRYYNDGTKWVRYQESFILKEFTLLVYTDTADPNTATVFDDANPVASHDALLMANTDYLYNGTDGSTWIWNGTAYVSYTAPDATAWYKSGTTIDAGSDKLGAINRKGQVFVGDFQNKSYGIVSDVSSANPSFGDISILCGVRGGATNQTTDVNSNSLWGGYFGVANNKDADFGSAYGVTIGATSNGLGKVTNLRGISSTVNTSATSGGLANGVSYTFNLTNNSTSTASATALDGVNGLVNHNSSQQTGSVRGLNITAQTGNTATIGNVTTMQGLIVSTNYRTLNTTGSNTNLQGINNSVLKSSSDVTANLFGYSSSINYQGAGSVGNDVRGISLTIGSSSTSTNSTGNMMGVYSSLSHTSATNTAGNLYGINNNITANGAISQSAYGIKNTVNITNPNTNFVSVVGNDTKITNLAGTTANIVTISGNYTNLINSSTSGLVTNMYGGQILVNSSNGSTGTMSNLMGTDMTVTNNGSNSVTNMYGINMDMNIGGTATKTTANAYGVRVGAAFTNASATTTNWYGLYLDNVPGNTTNKWSIYSNGGNSYFKDNVGIGTNDPKSKLHVTGLPVYADNATAKAAMGGAAAVGAFFHTGDGLVRVVF